MTPLKCVPLPSHRHSILQQRVFFLYSLVPLTYVMHSDFDQTVLSSCPPAIYLKDQDGDKHSRSGISVNTSHELGAHIALRRILDVLLEVAHDLIAQP